MGNLNKGRRDRARALAAVEGISYTTAMRRVIAMSESDTPAAGSVGGGERRWRFVHAGGAIGATDVDPVESPVPGILARYRLAAPTRDAAQLREAFALGESSALTALPARISAPLLGHVFRAALGVHYVPMLIVGGPGVGKTSLGAFAMSHWGSGWDRRNPGVWMSGNGDTNNAVRLKFHLAKDMLIWADDPPPFGLALEELIRFAAVPRSRHDTRGDAGPAIAGPVLGWVEEGEEANRASELAGDVEPWRGGGVAVARSACLITTELGPRPGTSAVSRSFAIELTEPIGSETLKMLDEPARVQARMVVMSSFIQWLAGDLDKMRDLADLEADRFGPPDVAPRELRPYVSEHRVYAAAEQLWAGWALLLRFLEEAGALSSQEQQQVRDRVQEGIRAASHRIVQADPSEV